MPGSAAAATSHLRCPFDRAQEIFCYYATPLLQDKLDLRLPCLILMVALCLWRKLQSSQVIKASRCLGTWFSGRLGSARLTVGLDDLRSFQT